MHSHDINKQQVKSESEVAPSTPTVVYQAPLSMGFYRQGYWSELPFPSPGELPVPGIEPRSPSLQEDGLLTEPPGKPEKVEQSQYLILNPFGSSLVLIPSAGSRSSAHGKGHEEGGSAYAKAGSSLRSPPGNS